MHYNTNLYVNKEINFHMDWLNNLLAIFTVLISGILFFYIFRNMFKELIKEGFTVMPYINADPVLAKSLEEIGCATVMPLGSSI